MSDAMTRDFAIIIKPLMIAFCITTSRLATLHHRNNVSVLPGPGTSPHFSRSISAMAAAGFTSLWPLMT